MLKILVNECKFDLIISPLDPILIKSGKSIISGPDMSFVRTYKFGEEQIYLPGSSLKGVIRSHGEKIARSLKSPGICMPFPKEGIDMFCGHKFTEREKYETITSETVYRDSCPICKLFGSTHFIGRISISDAYLKNGHTTIEDRDGVGIDRFTGGASRGAKFNMEVVTQGDFITSVYIRNFELWQLGLLGYILRDLEEGLISIGSGKSRGLGRVRGIISEEGVTISYTGRKHLEPSKLYGIGYYYGKEDDKEKGYGFVKEDIITTDDNDHEEWAQDGIRHRKVFNGENLPKVWKVLGPKWNDYIDNIYNVPTAMDYRKF